VEDFSVCCALANSGMYRKPTQEVAIRFACVLRQQARLERGRSHFVLTCYVGERSVHYSMNL
jgi:hypothetical protein